MALNEKNADVVYANPGRHEPTALERARTVNFRSKNVLEHGDIEEKWLNHKIQLKTVPTD